MIEVNVKNNNIDKALRILKRKIKEDRLFVTLREREFYRKPSDIKREKKNEDKTILFSPSAASFDSFKNFEDRGKKFNTLVKKLNLKKLINA